MFARTQTELESMAKRASEEYLSSGTPLNQAVQKLAVDYNLSSEQIKRVCEFANHRVNDTLLKKSSSRVFSFPLADAAAVVSTIRATYEPEPCACDNDYMSAPKTAHRLVMPSQTCIVLKHADRTEAEKTAASNEVIRRLNALMTDAKHIKTAALRKVAALRDDVYSMVERMIGSGYKLEDIYLASKTASPKPELVREVFTYVADRLKKEGKLSHAIKISLRKLSAEGDTSGEDGSLGQYPIGDHWVKIVMTNGTLKSKFNLLDEAQNDATKADAAMGHISDQLDMVKTVKK